MTKQEEIREGIKQIYLLPIPDFGRRISTGEEIANYCADRILQYLHSQGIVIKVEGKLPTDKNLYGVAKDNLAAGCYCHGQIDMKEDGYEAVMPLINETEGK